MADASTWPGCRWQLNAPWWGRAAGTVFTVGSVQHFDVLGAGVLAQQIIFDGEQPVMFDRPVFDRYGAPDADLIFVPDNAPFDLEATDG